jgi:hypothetical protein
VGSLGVIVFVVGAGAVIGVGSIAARKPTLGEDFLLYAAVISYALYFASSLSLSASINASRVAWVANYAAAMIPSVLLTSWPPITAAWPEALPAVVPSGAKLIGCLINNFAFCYASAWALLGVSRIVRTAWLMRAVVSITAIILPVAFWAAQIVLVEHIRGL